MRIPPGLEKGRSPLYEADDFGFKNAHAIFAPEPNPGTQFQNCFIYYG